MTTPDAPVVYLEGHLDVPPNRLKAVRAALPQHIALTRAEPGCLVFDVVESDTQPGRFLVSEVFSCDEAFEAHQARTRTSPWANVTDGIPRDYQMTRKPYSEPPG